MMEPLSDNSSAQAGKSQAIPSASLGTALRKAREHLGLSVADVANQIKFAPRQIDALEADDYQRLPEAAFLPGFIRSYAKILQLDAQKLLDNLPHSKNASMELVVPDSVGVPFPDAHTLLRQNLVLLVLAAVLALAAVGFALWNFLSPQYQTKVVKTETPVSLPAEVQIIAAPLEPGSSETVPPVSDTSRKIIAVAREQSSVPTTKTQPSVIETKIPPTKPASKFISPIQAQPTKPELKPVVPTQDQLRKPDLQPVAPIQVQSTKSEPQPVKAAPTPVAKPVALPDASSQITQLRLVFGAESWTEIKDRDGKIISSQVNPAGSELIVNGRAPFSMLIGHAFSVRLYHQGEPVDLTHYINKYSEVAHVTLK